MINRRNAMKLGAAGLIAPSLGIGESLATRHQAALAQDPGGSVPMFGGNAARTGEMPGPAPSMDRPIVVKWRVQTDLILSSSPVIADGVVFVSGMTSDPFSGTSTEGLLYAIDIKSGSELWRVETGGGWSSPAVNRDRILVGWEDGSLLALNTRSGAEIWRFQSGSGIQSAPAVDDSMVYFGSTDFQLYALDIDTGDEVWRFDSGYYFPQSPALANNMVILGGGQAYIYALDAETGAEKWRVNTSGGDGTASSPIVSNGTVLAVGDDGYLHALDLDTGESLWRVETGGVPQCPPSVADNVVYVDSDNGFLALDALTGNELWRLNSSDVSYPAQSVSGRIVFAGSSDGRLDAIDTQSGQLLWSFITPSPVRTAAPAVTDGVVISIAYGEPPCDVIYCLGSLAPSILTVDVFVRAAPSLSGVERGRARAGTEIDGLGTREDRNGETWIEVTLGDLSGWIPISAIDPSTLPPEGEMEYVHIPE